MTLPFGVTLENCDREPIHIPGLIQPHGALVAFDPGAGTVLHASGNLSRWFPVGILPIRGRSLADLLGDDAYESVEQALAGRAGGAVRHEVVDLPARPEQGQPLAFEAVVHAYRGVCIVELEPVVEPGAERDWMQMFGDTIDALRSALDLDDLVERTAQRVKRLIQFDRVMIYQFDEDWNGHVIADAREPDMESFLDLHYPATDIPAQARELFHSNLVRYIADIGYMPVPVSPWLDGERLQPLDMSHAVLRSVSPIHIQYLTNMGVGSSLTISLLVGDKLWGLIACHHRTPTVLPIRLRRACHALAITAGYMVGWNAQRRQAALSAASALAQTRIVEAFNQVQAPLGEVVEHSSASLLRIAGASGGAFWRDDTVLPFGQWPGGAQGAAVLGYTRKLLETSTEDILHTDKAPLETAPEPSELNPVCGIMAVRLDAFATSGIVWIRPEHRREVSWGGDPDKPVQVELDAAGQPMLSPRSSFARWQVVVKGRSRAWSELDIQAARSLLALRQVLAVRDSLAQVSLSDRHFRSLVALQSDAYCQLDVEGRVVTLSKPLPTGHGSVEGYTLVGLFAPHCDPGEIEALARALRSERPFRGLRLHGHRAAGQREFEVQLGGEPMKNLHGRITGWHGTITDLTHEIAVQTALRQVESAELSNLAKSRFLSQMSHELRTPLNAVLGFSQLLLMDHTVSQTQRDKLLHIQRAGDWLLVMISDLMDLSQIDTGNLTLHFRSVDASTVVAETMELVQVQAAARDVRLIGDAHGAPVWVHADASRLKQVLVNLASNALKYNRAQGEVRFTVKPEVAPGRTCIEVRDTGVGLTPEQIGQLFQPFNRLGREGLNIQGTGIGLVIAKQLIEAMDGTISVESEAGRGSTFSVTIASAQLPGEARLDASGMTRQAEAATDRVVLFVEDDATSVVLVESIVGSLPGVRLVHANTAQRGLELARELMPVVVLIDIKLSGLDGMWLLKAIKNDPALRQIRCIAVNASALGETLKELQVVGFEDRWTEPIDLKTIASGLDAALSA